ncbi:helix-turn-helix domain-containing protein [Tsuneonella sp. HG094]
MRDIPSDEASPFHGLDQERSRCRKLVAGLAPAERRILELLVGGEGPRGIAERLGIAEATVGAYRRTLLMKLGAACTADAVRVAVYAEL